MMKLVNISVFALASVVLSACGVVGGGSLVPEGNVQLTPSKALSIEKLANIGAVGYLMYVIYDPLAPNWSIEETVIDDQTYSLSLRAKSFRTGGDGEAMMILKRRALKLQREKGYAGYRILDYSEGVASSTPFTQRFSEGTIQLVRAEAAPKKAY